MIAAVDTQDRVKARLIRNILHDFPRAMQLHAAPVICSISNPAEEMQSGQLQSAATASPASFSGISSEQAAAVREGMKPCAFRKHPRASLICIGGFCIRASGNDGTLRLTLSGRPAPSPRRICLRLEYLCQNRSLHRQAPMPDIHKASHAQCRQKRPVRVCLMAVCKPAGPENDWLHLRKKRA